MNFSFDPRLPRYTRPSFTQIFHDVFLYSGEETGKKGFFTTPQGFLICPLKKMRTPLIVLKNEKNRALLGDLFLLAWSQAKDLEPKVLVRFPQELLLLPTLYDLSNIITFDRDFIRWWSIETGEETGRSPSPSGFQPTGVQVFSHELAVFYDEHRLLSVDKVDSQPFVSTQLRHRILGLLPPPSKKYSFVAATPEGLLFFKSPLVKPYPRRPWPTEDLQSVTVGPEDSYFLCTHSRLLLADQNAIIRAVFEGHSDMLTGFHFCKNRSIVTWSRDSTLMLHFNQENKVNLFGHKGPVTDVLETEDGFLLSASTDGTLRLWDPRGIPKQLVSYPGSLVYRIARGPNFSFFTFHEDGSILLWDKRLFPVRSIGNGGFPSAELSFKIHAAPLRWYAFSPTEAYVWDETHGTIENLPGTPEPALLAQFLSEGTIDTLCLGSLWAWEVVRKIPDSVFTQTSKLAVRYPLGFQDVLSLLTGFHWNELELRGGNDDSSSLSLYGLNADTLKLIGMPSLVSVLGDNCHIGCIESEYCANLKEVLVKGPLGFVKWANRLEQSHFL